MFDPRGPVLGVDPGVSVCGYGAVRLAAGTAHATAYGALRTDPADELPRRLARLAAELEALVADVRPAAVAVERVLFQANVRTAISVGQASGLALVAAARAGVPVALYSPNEVKLAVAGDGRADKAAVQAMVARLLRLGSVPEPPDAADALALALCHAWGARLAGQTAPARPDGRAEGADPARRLARAIDAARARDDAARRTAAADAGGTR